MLKWLDVTKLAVQGNLEADKRVEKTDAQWREQLSDVQYQVTRNHGTEQPFSGEFCEAHQPGLYGCVCCDTLLFDSRLKYESGTGWPSFTQPIKENSIKYIKDDSHGMTRIEVQCNTCDSHLGHVFPDGPKPSGLRYCTNSASLKIVQQSTEQSANHIEKATFGGGCFWCVEAVIVKLKGVIEVSSGYSGGEDNNPSYKEVCGGKTGHAEVIQVSYDTSVISFKDLLEVFFTSHDPTTLNRQGGDVGTQYRSVIYYHNDIQKQTALDVIASLASVFDAPIVTQVEVLTEFFKAEQHHQNYYENNQSQPFCQAVISPKIAKLKEKHADKLK